MLVITTLEVEGYRIVDYRGIVRGIIVRAPTIMQGFWGTLKNMLGGNIGAYTAMCEQTRQLAYKFMVEHAQAVGANAVIGMRYDSSQVSSGGVSGTEVLCYGTAVVLDKIRS
ncbi:MAG: YbjQ family protein [Gammaproteobacteria bacterium]|nr:YbjQ family protein [Gammaproteobacteria bacterium]MCW5584331.1 YbjQ family protein [Gammaproteobacteria bacterium]